MQCELDFGGDRCIVKEKYIGKVGRPISIKKGRCHGFSGHKVLQSSYAGKTRVEVIAGE